MKWIDYRKAEQSISRLIRTKRKTIVIIIERDASVTVRAPKRVPKKEIVEFVKSKKDWISEKQKEASEKARQSKSKKFIEGEMFLYLGKQYPLMITDETGYALRFNNGNFVMHSKCQKDAKNIFVRWYKSVALKYLAQRIEHYSNLTGIKYNSIHINNAQSRWGSCGFKGTINFTWRLIMAPSEIIDYIVVHELAHMKELNHSQRFWNIVKSIYPNYSKAKKWLTDNGHILNI